MKKVICFISVLLFGILLSILILTKTRNVTEKMSFYTIPRMYAYRYEEDKRMSFEIFGTTENSLIEYVDENKFFIENKHYTFPLLDVQIHKNLDYRTKEETYYKYIVSAKIFSISDDDICLKNCKLVIENSSYVLNLELGDLNIYKNTYDTLDFTDLYGNYTYIDNELHLIGITIQLSSQYKILYEVKVGEASCLFDKIEKDIIYDSQRDLMDLEYEPISQPAEHTSFKLDGKYGYYYIPFVYQDLKLITEVAILFYIDGNIYSINDFLYLANEISLKDYENSKKIGTILYA